MSATTLALPTLLAGSLAIPALGQEVELTGLVRDLREFSVAAGHPDFEKHISTGIGQYSGNIDIFTQDHKPVFVGGGSKILIPATDAMGRPIAPHMVNMRYVHGATLMPQATEVILQDSKGIDAYEIHFLSAEFNVDGTSTWSYQVQETGIGQDMSHWLLVIDPAHTVMPGTTPGYDVGVDASTGFYGIKWDVDDAFESQTFVIVLDEHYKGKDATCSVVAKGGSEADQDDLFAPTKTVAPDGTPFQSTPGPALISDDTLGDTPATVSVDSNGGITSAHSFYSWYHDNPPMNMSTIKSITLVRDETGNYVFDAMADPYYSGLGGFFPIDGELLGNSGGSPDHNFHFTFELHAEFTYDKSAGQFIRFTGDDDVWVFVDDKLAIDLGGIHGPLEQFADLDRMGLVDGVTYHLDLFFAERHRTQSNFMFETNLELVPIDPETVSAIFD